jgi:divalent metal cation (Fe/Co/Zn/Cd) transporter
MDTTKIQNINEEKTRKFLNYALALSIVTIVYNVAEGLISVFFGMEDETLSLLGFGIDSFIEVISGIGILHMVLRMKKTPVEKRDQFERTALRITGTSFYILTGGLLIGTSLNLFSGHKPETTIVGIIVSSVSILTMFFLMKAKLFVGRTLNSEAIISDANCTKTCFYLSFVLLAASGLYELFEIGYIDLIGSAVIAYFAFSEGKEAFEKAKSGSLQCGCADECPTVEKKA